MNITIQAINPRESVPVPGTSQLGYPAEFKTPSVTGFATIVPSASGTGKLAPGSLISVDARQEYISKFALLDEAVPTNIEALENHGDYRVEGRVIFCYEPDTFGVEAGGFIFSLSRDDARGRLPETGEYVSFQLHGLSLWDRNR